ncbi:MAG: ATP-binding protein [Humidesulfovibrio sp.]|uniref:ATP-binding protein n=1 Tax=Humidesulfovibrio sp. TaxID=2910988 RepID=UPI0027ECA250|nr:ATP-binding protein [Humidesulfovibrio sp.]MDQ7835068.1 ATP-binding protein [Humidesulfovibrio sp.]
MPKPSQRTSPGTSAPRATNGRGGDVSLRLARGLAACSDMLHGAKRNGGSLARALGALVRKGGLTRAAVFLNHDDPERGLALSLLAEAQGNGTPPLAYPPLGQQVGYATLGLGRLAQDLFKGNALHGTSDDFPASERPFLEQDGPTSTALLPMRHDGAWLGFVRVDAAVSRRWTLEDMALLRVLADLLGGRVGRERAEATLLAGAQALRGMVENMPVLVVAFDAHGEIVFWNRECERVSGYSALEVLHDRATPERLFPDEAFRRSLRGRGQDHRDLESRLSCKDGSERIIAWSDISRQYPLPGWKAWRIGVDMSQRLLVEQAVIQAKQEWESTFDSVPDPILILDGEMRVRRLNMALGSRLGVHPRSLVGKFLVEVAEEAGDNHVTERILALANCAFCSSEELTIPRWGGHFLVAVSPFHKHDAGRVGTIVVAHDISRWKELERQLEQSRRLEALGTLAGGIAHDFNNILGVMLGYAEMLEVALSGGPQERRVEEILRAGTRAKELIAQILTFSRQGEGTPVPLRLTPLVKEVLQHLLVTMPQGISVRRRFDSASDMVLGDPSLVHQVVLNLCTNAVQAMGDTGGILEVAVDELYLGVDRAPDLSTLEPGTYVRLRVRDTGPGIPAAIVERIFDPFFTTKRPGEGSGMGLAVVHGIVHKLGGLIGVESVPGLGTTMRVLLPRARTAVELAPPQSVAMGGGQASVLLVDDEASLLSVWREALTGLGYEVTTAGSGEEALTIFAANPDTFDLVLTDQIMPGLSGTDFVGGVRALRPGLPVIVWTGFSDTAAREAAAGLGVFEILSKPVRQADLVQCMERALKASQGGEGA